VSCIFLNPAPLDGFVNKSARMFAVGQNATLTSLFLIFYVTKSILD